MADIRRVPLLLLVLFAAAIGGYFIIKSQIQKDFVIAEMPNVVAEPVLEFNITYEYDYRTGTLEWYGETPLAIFPYYYNNIPYALVTGFSVSGTYIDKMYVRLYDLVSKSIVSEKIISYPEGYVPIIGGRQSPFYYYYYIDKSGRLIATIALELWSESDGKWLVYKAIVDKGNITEFKLVFSSDTTNYSLEGRWISGVIVFEGIDKDYVVLVSIVTPPTDWRPRTEITILDDLGNILYSFVDNNAEYNMPYYIVAYETNNTVVFAIGVEGVYPDGTSYSITYSIIYDKNTKTYKVDSILGLSIAEYPSKTLTGYNEDIVFLWTGPIVGYVRGEKYSEYNFMNYIIGWIKGDKIFGIKWENNYPVSYEVKYTLMNYTFTDDRMSIYLLAQGLFMNLTPPFFNGTGTYFDIIWTNKYVEVLGLDKRYLPILYIVREYGTLQEYLPGLWASTDRGAEYIALVDLDNYKVYNIKISDIQETINVTTQGDLGIIKVVGPEFFITDSLLVLSLYHPRFLIPIASVIATEIRNVTAYEPISTNLTIRTVVYMLTTVIQQPQPQPKPRPGPGVEIVPVETVVAPPQYNVTENITVTRPTYPGIQSIIEIIRERPWIILVAILLLVLIASSLRKRAT